MIPRLPASFAPAPDGTAARRGRLDLGHTVVQTPQFMPVGTAATVRAQRTEDLAQRSGIDLLTLRPRNTELVQLGLVILAGGRARSGVYRAATAEEAAEHFRDQQATAHGRPVQAHLALNLSTPSRYY